MPLFELPLTENLCDDSQRDLYTRWIASLENSQDMIFQKIRRQECCNLKIERIDEIKGNGVVAACDITENEIVCDYHGRYIPFREHKLLDEEDKMNDNRDCNRYLMELPIYKRLLHKEDHLVSEKI